MEIVDGVAAGAVVTVALGAFQVLKIYGPKAVNGGDKKGFTSKDRAALNRLDNGHRKTDVEGRPLWYFPREDFKQMSKNIECVSNECVEQTEVLRSIHKELSNS